ncbi:hypothetical protein GCM10023082_27380 [Streptomyces tremellae]|uniref:Uncharacterized protein n=1 Tax=Streptomyces tremellae TaxID=1124239 RepID=A0ABP7EYT6_9ACTN
MNAIAETARKPPARTANELSAKRGLRAIGETPPWYRDLAAPLCRTRKWVVTGRVLRAGGGSLASGSPPEALITNRAAPLRMP